jgi:hypothetical protein
LEPKKWRIVNLEAAGCLALKDLLQEVETPV